MKRIIFPRTYVEELQEPLIFLAGPISGAPEWRDEAIKILFSKKSDLDIASPEVVWDEELSAYTAEGDTTRFHRNRAWERYYLEKAAHMGAILFWLPGEEMHSCRYPYGAITRLELGQWMTRYRFDNSIRFCVGTDGNFPTMRTIRYDLSQDASDKVIFNTLEEVCEEALRLALG